MTDTPLTDAGLAGLNHQPDLQYLFLDKTQITDAGLASLKIPKLVKIDVTGSKVTEAGAQQFRQRTGAEVVTDAGAAGP